MDGSDFFALRQIRIEFGFFCSALRLNLRALRSERNFRLLERGFGGFDFALGVFDGHHLFELAVFGSGGFGFSVCNFMLEGFVGFVGFYRSALIAVFARAFAPLIYVEFKFFAFRLRVRMFFFRSGNPGTGAAQHRIRFLDALGKRFQLRAQSGDAQIKSLQLQKLRNRGIHAERV